MDTAGRAPGVYVQPIDSVGPIVGVGTSTVAMIGKPARVGSGVRKGMPSPVTSWTVYTNLFGEFGPSLALPHAVRGFFQNGGSFLYVIPVDDTDDLAVPIDQLTRTPDVNIVCAPGVTTAAALNPLIAHCADARNRFAILDGPAQPEADADDPVTPLDDGALLDLVGDLSKSEFAGLYWPWIMVSNPTPADADNLTSVPPSGHIAGIMARSDARYGVHKAPANEEVRGALDLEFQVNSTEQGRLNDRGINVIRRFPGRPPVLWGARTLSQNTAWRYVNVRRLVSYIEESLTTGLAWALFEANTTALWKSLERTISEFLDRIWRSGALFGRTAEQAYYVRIDEELNPRETRRQGQVFIEVGIAPVEPAEFVIVRLGLLDGSRAERG